MPAPPCFQAGGSVFSRIEHQVVGDVVGAVAGIGGAAAQLGDPAGDALKVAAAAAVLDVTCRVKPLAVPRPGRGVGEVAAIALHVAGDVEDAPGALVATIELLDDVDGAAVEIATLAA